MRSYTNLEQSKKLAEILPLESADMWWAYYYNVISDTGEYDKEPMLHKPICDPDKALPCWSLTALFDALPDGSDIVKEQSDDTDGKYMCTVGYKNDILSTFSDSPVDACVAMIERLRGLNLLRL